MQDICQYDNELICFFTLALAPYRNTDNEDDDNDDNDDEENTKSFRRRGTFEKVDLVDAIDFEQKSTKWEPSPL